MCAMLSAAVQDIPTQEPASLAAQAEPRNAPVDAEAAWQAVVERDRRYRDAFVYAVTSTGVFCRPSCPSRRPRRDRVRFYPTAAEASAAGYRPCRRCRPERDGSRDERLVRRACELLEADLSEPMTLVELAARTGVSPSHLRRVFRRVTGVTPREYREAKRLERTRTELGAGRSVTATVYEAGFGSGSRLYEKSDAHLGMTPATYGRGGEGMEIRYVVADSPLGRVLVGATARGLCAVALGSDDARLVAALEEEYPKASIERSGDGLDAAVRDVLARIEGREPSAALPLDVRATAFQRLVWQELQRIPRGATRSYGEIAHAIGRPGAARAVARACATNPVAVAIPCHRVVGSGGELRGYRWGAERKRALLDRERRVP